MKRRGFTLVEVMVVVGIIGLLTALAVVTLSRQQARSRDARRVGDISNIRTALENWIDEKQQVPTTYTYPNANGSGTYNATDHGGWDVSSLPAGNPTFLQFLSDYNFLNPVPKDPINNATDENHVGAYIYHYYDVNSGTFGYKDGWKAYALIAYLETPGFIQPAPMRNGQLFGDGSIANIPYAYVVHEPVVKN